MGLSQTTLGFINHWYTKSGKMTSYGRGAANTSKTYPAFSKLPLDPSHPPYSAWGLYGMEDELGTLNQLTLERTVAAAKEIKTGLRIGLNWGLEQMDYTGEFRETMKHEIFEIGKNMNNYI